MKKLFLLLLTLSQAAHASGEGGKSLEDLQCWDHTFFYNRLQIDVENEFARVDFSGGDLAIFKRIFGLSTQVGGHVKASFYVPVKNCRRAEDDLIILTCQVNELNVSGEIRLSSHSEHRAADLNDVTVHLRKVEELSAFNGKVTKGYEFAIVSRGEQLLTHRYFYGLDGDETSNCKLGSIPKLQ